MNAETPASIQDYETLVASLCERIAKVIEDGAAWLGRPMPAPIAQELADLDADIASFNQRYVGRRHLRDLGLGDWDSTPLRLAAIRAAERVMMVEGAIHRSPVRRLEDLVRHVSRNLIQVLLTYSDPFETLIAVTRAQSSVRQFVNADLLNEEVAQLAAQVKAP